MRALSKAFVISLLLAALPAAFSYAQPGPSVNPPELSFPVKGSTPQMLAENPTINYQPELKFPNYVARTGFKFSTSVNRREWNIGDRLDLNYDAGRSGYVTIIDYSPDGIAHVILRNKPLREGFAYVFTSEVSEPAGDDHLRAVLSSTMLNEAALQSLCEYPCDNDTKVNLVVVERWLKITVRGGGVQRYQYRDDPFYNYPHRWYRRLDNDDYLYVQPSGNAVLTRGLNMMTNGVVYSDFTEYGPAQYWLLEPGDNVELDFGRDQFPYNSQTVYLVLYMSQDSAAALMASYESPRLRVRLNDITIADGFKPQYTGFYDDSPPEVIPLKVFTLAGNNRLELSLDSFSGIGLRVRRIELRANLDSFSSAFIWQGGT